MFCPRPILKRTPSKQPHHSSVHFPSSPLLTRTFDAPSYDRSPIVVVPNSCALPERGGRCYNLSDTKYPPRAVDCPELIPDESDESDDSCHSTSSSLLFCGPNTPTAPLPDYSFAQAPETQPIVQKKPPRYCDDLPFPPSPSPTKKKKRIAMCKAFTLREREREPSGGCLDGF
ncbi:hypothetical protein BDZ89DRAFT_781369 [Hymenopellis radicata]|nr:hypothetical protein BDZ89DRAFT_781369 [Hymenopellis radicata]